MDTDCFTPMQTRMHQNMFPLQVLICSLCLLLVFFACSFQGFMDRALQKSGLSQKTPKEFLVIPVGLMPGGEQACTYTPTSGNLVMHESLRVGIPGCCILKCHVILQCVIAHTILSAFSELMGTSRMRASHYSSSSSVLSCRMNWIATIIIGPTRLQLHLRSKRQKVSLGF